jgi:hypothetical protein
MKRLTPRKLALLALVLALAAGAAAALAAGGSGGKGATQTHNGAAKALSDVQLPHRHAHRSLRPTLGAAASYLGSTVAKLRSDLRTGKSLAQIAKETPGKSEAGLIAAVEQVRQKKITKAQQRLDGRVSTQVRIPGGPRAGRHIFSLREDARTYLGLSVSKLHGEERAGRSLARIASEMPGKSEAGLETAIFNARRQQLETAVKAGAMTAASESASLAHLQRRIHAYVDRVLRFSASPLSAAPSTS